MRPVGLLGELMITARVRGVMAAPIASRSRSKVSVLILTFTGVSADSTRIGS
jgi:hypothetical protein